MVSITHIEQASTSFYEGVVVNNNDPLNLGRLLVRVPMIHGDTSPNGSVAQAWCLPKSILLLEGGGFYIIPQIGDTVNVSFELNNVRYGHWSFRYVTEVTKLPHKAYFIQDNRGVAIADTYVSLEGDKILLGGDSDSNEFILKGVTLIDLITKKDEIISNYLSEINIILPLLVTNPLLYVTKMTALNVLTKTLLSNYNYSKSLSKITKTK